MAEPLRYSRKNQAYTDREAVQCAKRRTPTDTLGDHPRFFYIDDHELSVWRSGGRTIALINRCCRSDRSATLRGSSNSRPAAIQKISLPTAWTPGTACTSTHTASPGSR